MTDYVIRPIAHIENDYVEKFGIPRQSGLAKNLVSRIVFERAYADKEALKGIEAFDYLWLIWIFTENADKGWQPTVRPPKLGGNEHRGVFATRSPFRPNPLGLSCVKLVSVDLSNALPVLTVTGADLMNGTTIVDIKPYIAYTDAHAEAKSGEYGPLSGKKLKVALSPSASIPADFSETSVKALQEVLALDPRPGYQDDPDRVYGMAFGNYNVKFTVEQGTCTIVGVERRRPEVGHDG